jgi:hypothetical protein
MILINWFLEILLAIKPVFFDGGNIYEEESRLCIYAQQCIVL